MSILRGALTSTHFRLVDSAIAKDSVQFMKSVIDVVEKGSALAGLNNRVGVDRKLMNLGRSSRELWLKYRQKIKTPVNPSYHSDTIVP